MKAIGMYIFGGSQTIGHIQVGWEIDQVLEMTEDMTENNAYHFHKNYPEINILKPSEWDNEEYIKSLKNKYDLLFANNPCSGLSSINRNAGVDNKQNKYFYDVIRVIDEIKPKAFLIENAPTLITLGLPILKDLVKKLKQSYYFTIITDLAGNHSVSMHRRRTLVVGWSKSKFKSIPEIKQEKQPMYTVRECLDNVEGLPNMELNKHAIGKEFFKYYYLVPENTSIQIALSKNIDKIQEPEVKEKIIKFKNRLETKRSVWDKSAFRLSWENRFPSMTSLSQFIHPDENRDLYVREYARVMGYPDDFIFYQDGCKCSVIQCLVQGVPVNFIKYISTQIKNAFENPIYIDNCEVLYINQVSGEQKKTMFTYDEFEDTDKINKNIKSLFTFS